MGQSCIRPIPGYKLEWITTSYLSSSLTVVLLPALSRLRTTSRASQGWR